MTEFLYNIDVAIFHFINGGLSTWVGDQAWPVITDYDKIAVVRILLAAVWLLLVVKGGKRGRTAALLLIVVLVAADQFSSFVLKPLIQRDRPCHVVQGEPVVENIHLLVGCGSGKSFPSSHAVNNFAVATLFALFYRRWRFAFYAWAALIALSRVFVGVHYPSDIAGGALIGGVLAFLIVKGWGMITRRWIPAIFVSTGKESVR